MQSSGEDETCNQVIAKLAKQSLMVLQSTIPHCKIIAIEWGLKEVGCSKKEKRKVISQWKNEKFMTEGGRGASRSTARKWPGTKHT